MATQIGGAQIDLLIRDLPPDVNIASSAGLREELAELKSRLRKLPGWTFIWKRGWLFVGKGVWLYLTKGGWYLSIKIGPCPQEEVADIGPRKVVLERLMKPLWLGYRPYSLPSNFYIGNPEGGWEHLMPKFRDPLPADVQEKYDQARRTKAFRKFVIASPDERVFEQFSGRSGCTINLIGFVQTEEWMFRSQTYSWSGHKVEVGGAVGFLIAAWEH